MHIHQNINKFIVMSVITSNVIMANGISMESVGVNAGVTKIKYIVDSAVNTTPDNTGSNIEIYTTFSNVFSNKNIKPTLNYIYNTNGDIENHTALVGINQNYPFNYFTLYSGLLVGYGQLELNNTYSLKSAVGAAQIGLEFPMTHTLSFNFNSKIFVHNYESNLNSAPYMGSASVGIKYSFGASSKNFIVTDEKPVVEPKEQLKTPKEEEKVGEESSEDWSFDDKVEVEAVAKEPEVVVAPDPVEPTPEPEIIEKKEPIQEIQKPLIVAEKKVVEEKIEPPKEQKPVVKKSASQEKKEPLEESAKTDFNSLDVDEMDFDWLLEDDAESLQPLKVAKGPDSDNDGVIDKEDLCVDTPANESVDASGCPKDSDGDGVVDSADKCANSVEDEIVNESGCPKDSDKDGIIDRLDKCSNSLENEIVDTQGCAKDSDGDGVVDRADRCINTPKGQSVNEFGCSENGFDTKARAALYAQPVYIEAPKVEKAKVKAPLAPLENIATATGEYPTRLNFPYKSKEVDDEQNKQLDALAAYLKAHPEYELYMKSHTDSIGSATYNFNLASKRAESVTQQLVDRGIKRARISYESMGEKEPLVSNMLKSGREQNRRIDIFLIKR